MPQTPEYSEVIAGTPEQLFAAVKNHHEWAPKMLPHIYKQGDRHEGDGEAGSVYHYDIHEESPDVHGGAPKLKMVMEDYNKSTLSYVVDFQGDPRYSHFKYCVRFLPGPSSGTTTVIWVVDYTPVTDNTPPPDDLHTHMVVAVFKDLAAHLDSKKPENQ